MLSSTFPELGNERIQGELLKLGHRVGASTIGACWPAWGDHPHRPGTPTPAGGEIAFRTQASTIVACDFFHVECAVTLRRIYVFFVIEINSPLRPPPRRHHASGRTVDHPASQESPTRPRRSGRTVPVPGTGSGRPVHQILRRGPRRLGHQHQSDPTPMPASKLLRRAIRRNRASRTHRPNADLRPAAPSTASARVRPPLQHATTPPRPAAPPPTTRAHHSGSRGPNIVRRPILGGLINEHRRAA